MPACEVNFTAVFDYTGIDKYESTDNGRQTVIIYDLQGRKIEVSDLGELKQGVYIVNGRSRVVIK